MKSQNYEIIVQQQLKKLRAIRAITQLDVATILEVGKSTYCQYENGDRKISIDKLCKLADEFDLPLDWFVGRNTTIDTKLKNQ